MNRAAVILVIGATIAAAGWLLKSDYLVSVATSMAFFALWAQSWNLLCGLTGNISLGHSVFIAVAAYVAARTVRVRARLSTC
jgi:branched-chain amino acid transport system permease protein